MKVQGFRVDGDSVESARRWIEARVAYLAAEVNRWRRRLSEVYNEDVGQVSVEDVKAAVGELFDDRVKAVNLTALLALALSLESDDDIEELVVDDMLGEAIAELIAGGEPTRTIARSNFHLFDMYSRGPVEGFGEEKVAVDDLFAGLVAGLEAIMPGWGWMSRVEGS